MRSWPQTPARPRATARCCACPDTRGWHGRTFAITVSVNVAGGPIGAVLAGLLAEPLGVHALLFAAGAAQLAAAAAAALMLSVRPASDANEAVSHAPG